MKLGKKDDLAGKTKKVEVGDMSFEVKPMAIDLVFKFQGYASQEEDAKAVIATNTEKRHFAKTHIVDWDVYDENDQPIEFTKENVVAALTDEDNHEIFVALYFASLGFRAELNSKIDEDKEKAKK